MQVWDEAIHALVFVEFTFVMVYYYLSLFQHCGTFTCIHQPKRNGIHQYPFH